VLSSRSFGVSIEDIPNQANEQPGRVFVCRYVGQESPILSQLDKSDLEILFGGCVEALPENDVAEGESS
jgi:hypothetical protein